MARLKLADGTNLKQVGHSVFEAAAAFATGSESEKLAAESRIMSCFNCLGKQVEFRYHYDHTRENIPGVRISVVNIVVPNMEGKVRDSTMALSVFDLSDLAAESMGYVVIMGCGD